METSYTFIYLTSNLLWQCSIQAPTCRRSPPKVTKPYTDLFGRDKVMILLSDHLGLHIFVLTFTRRVFAPEINKFIHKPVVDTGYDFLIYFMMV